MSGTVQVCTPRAGRRKRRIACTSSVIAVCHDTTAASVPWWTIPHQSSSKRMIIVCRAQTIFIIWTHLTTHLFGTNRLSRSALLVFGPVILYVLTIPVQITCSKVKIVSVTISTKKQKINLPSLSTPKRILLFLTLIHHLRVYSWPVRYRANHPHNYYEF